MRWRFEAGIWVGSNSLEINRLEVVDQNIASWNPVISWLRRIERLKFAE